MPYCYLGLGSNLKNPHRQLTYALQHLKQLPHTTILKTAPYFRNPAWGKKGLPNYYNTVVLIKTRTPPLKLLNYLHHIEKKQGRIRTVKNAARTLDIDILSYDNLVLNHPHLILPHPKINERAFVQIPLSQIVIKPRITIKNKPTSGKKKQKNIVMNPCTLEKYGVTI